MLRYLIRRLLLMIPVFLGITLATFALLSLAEDRLLPGGGGEDVSARSRLSEDAARRVRESLGYDLPAFFNTDVEDARRTVQAAADRVVEGWPRLASSLRETAYRAGREAGLSELEASAAAERARTHVRGQILRGRASSDGLVRISGRGGRSVSSALKRYEPDVSALIFDQSTLRRLGAQTVTWIGPSIAAAGDGEAAAFLVASAAAAGGLEEGADAADVAALLDAAHADDRWAAPTIERLVDEWFIAAEEEERRLRVGDAVADARADRLAAARPVVRAGGLMMAAFMPRVLEASPWIKGMASDLLAVGGEELRFQAYGAPGEPLSSDQSTLHAIQSDRLRRWWARNELRFRVVSDFERWAWLSWTHTRYGRWLGSVLTFDWGESIEHVQSVRSLIAERLPFTLLLQAAALIVMYVVAVPLGTWAAVRRKSWIDRALAAVAFLLYSAPSFWIATLLVLGLGGVFPMSGIRSADVDRAILSGSLSRWSWTALIDLAWHCVLPVFVLAYGGAAALQRFARAGVLETLRQPWVRAARARGVPERRVLTRHVLRPGLTPLVTLLGVLLPGLVAGSVVVERIFGIPGMGLLAWEAVIAHDVPVVMAVVTLSSFATMTGYLVADLLYAWVDPRVRR